MVTTRQHDDSNSAVMLPSHDEYGLTQCQLSAVFISSGPVDVGSGSMFVCALVRSTYSVEYIWLKCTSLIYSPKLLIYLSIPAAVSAESTSRTPAAMFLNLSSFLLFALATAKPNKFLEARQNNCGVRGQAFSSCLGTLGSNFCSSYLAQQTVALKYCSL